MKFLEDAMKKTLKKLVLKATRKGKALCEEVLKNVSMGGDKDLRANFWGWIKYFRREYGDGIDEYTNDGTLMEGTNFVSR